MARFEPGSKGVKRDRLTNLATATVQKISLCRVTHQVYGALS